ncbi:MAG TPA: hypothetical protein ENJ17_05115 [Gammaproteobacteria bacterium]|nr:hypothetical protein [Gammaproteobacteria bacterium]
MHSATIKLTIAAAFIGLLLSSPTFADERMPQRGMHSEEGNASRAMPQHSNLPKYYPSHFDRQGFVRSIVQDGKVMISGVRYTVSPNVRVHTRETRNASIYALREDTEVGIKLDPSGRNVIAIWVLPKGSVPQN